MENLTNASQAFEIKAINHDFKPINPDARVLDRDELAETILRECKGAARRAGYKYGHHKMTELEGTLIQQIWEVLMKKPTSFHTVMFIRRLIKQRTINHIKRDLIPFNNEINFTVFENDQYHDKETGDMTNTITTGDKRLLVDSADIELSTTLKAFRETLTDKQLQILDLTYAGYGNNEICDIVGCSINTPKNTLNKIKELAMSFGL